MINPFAPATLADITDGTVIGLLHTGATTYGDVFGLADDGTTMYAVAGTEIFSVDVANATMTPLFDYSLAENGQNLGAGVMVAPSSMRVRRGRPHPCLSLHHSFCSGRQWWAWAFFGPPKRERADQLECAQGAGNFAATAGVLRRLT